MHLYIYLLILYIRGQKQSKQFTMMVPRCIAQDFCVIASEVVGRNKLIICEAFRGIRPSRLRLVDMASLLLEYVETIHEAHKFGIILDRRSVTLALTVVALRGTVLNTASSYKCTEYF